MANLFSYIDKYGDKTFKEEKFNEVDAVILSSLSYINFDGIVSKKKDKIVLMAAANEFFAMYTEKEIKNHIFSIYDCIKILDYIKYKKRYRDLLVYNYLYESGYEKQFSVLFIDLDESTTFISFEGTDELVSGWKEDLCLAYKYPVESQKLAIKYINTKVEYFSKRKYILGGHSKGGNLALVAAMHSNFFIRGRIQKIYSFDGPGLNEKQIESVYYKRIKDKYEHIIPNNCIVGICLKSYKNKVIKSNKKDLFLSHSILSWDITDKEFTLSPLSEFSKGLEKILNSWVSSYSNQELKKMVDDMFLILEKSGIDNLLDIKESKLSSIIRIMKNTKDIDPRTKKIMGEFVKYFASYVKEYEINKVKNIFNKKGE